MGCGYTNKSLTPKLAVQLLSKLPKLSKNPSNVTENPAFSRQQTIKTPQCLNIKIVSESPVILLTSLSLSGTSLSMSSFEYVPYFNFIKQIYSQYTSSKRHFFNKVHETCFTDFTIKDGLIIMLISSFGNPSVQITISQNFPFFEVSGKVHPETDEILQAWTAFVEEIQTVLKNNSKKIKKAVWKMQEFSSELQGFIKSTVRQALIKKAIKLSIRAVELGHEIRNEVENLYEEIFLFFRENKKEVEELKKLGKKAESFQSFSGERIVHELLMNNYFY